MQRRPSWPSSARRLAHRLQPHQPGRLERSRRFGDEALSSTSCRDAPRSRRLRPGRRTLASHLRRQCRLRVTAASLCGVAAARGRERAKRQGSWMEVKTTFSATAACRSNSRRRRFRTDSQQRTARGARERTGAGRQASVGLGLESTNYECAEPELDASGLLRVPLRPRRKDVNLIFGGLFLQPSTGDVVRVAAGSQRARRSGSLRWTSTGTMRESTTTSCCRCPCTPPRRSSSSDRRRSA